MTQARDSARNSAGDSAPPCNRHRAGPAAGRLIRAAVVGGGIAGLTAAWELARAGAQVDLYEAADRLGGAVAPLHLGPVTLDAGAEAFATRSPAVPEFLAELGLADAIVHPNPAGAWLQLPQQAAPLPATGLLGIPADPLAEDVVRILGPQAARRAAEDLTAPPSLTAEDSPSLGELVRSRMGEQVLQKLVAPITSGVHSADPDQLPASTAHPRLLPAVVEHGSLARAVASLRAQAPAGSAVASLHGGMHTLITALRRHLDQMGLNIHLRSPVTDLHQLEADHLVLAVDAPTAQALAAPLLAEADSPGTSRQVQNDAAAESTAAESAEERQPGGGVALVTLLIRSPALDEHPRGTGMLVAPTVEGIGAKALTHISAKWEWVRHRLTAELGDSHHLVRLSYGRIGQAHGLGAHSTDEQLLEAAGQDIGALMGVPIAPGEILDAAVVRWQRGLPGAARQRMDAARSLRSRLQQAESSAGMRVTAAGAWFAGTGFAQIIPDARQAAAALLNNS
ncbi:protoporphyrinogen oxidase [Nesterenkonia sp.]|uniref:protoporphyrinogen oxidase n=1 Tax=Nesterenkonia sp. TaxID=704201 RepID=UPI00262AB415|nr:protoporphyrinogen oxidase [Nesterenkonia sp.]